MSEKPTKHIEKRAMQRKELFSCSNEDVRLRITYIYNPNVDNTYIRTGFSKRTQDKRKRLFSYRSEGVVTSLRCVYVPSTDTVYISSEFSKQGGWNGGAATNPTCALYLGVVVAEHVLAKIFKNVKKMPNGNQGFDFICGKGYKIDVKSSCLLTDYRGRWSFHIKKNTIADYFLCLAFDNRSDLNPKHLWLIPGRDINHLITASISKSNLDRWKQYELTNKLDEVISCCNTMKS